MYPRSFLCEEAKIKQRTSSKKELHEIDKEAIWESRFTSFFQYRFFISLFHKLKYRWNSTKYYRTVLRFNETYFFGMKKKKPYEQPNPWTWK